MKKKFYISELHLFREKAIPRYQRPFQNTEEMHQKIRENWMRKVLPKDEVYILGDVGMYHQEEIARFLQELPGEKYLVTGKHDAYNIKNRSFQEAFKEISPYMEVEDQGRMVVLSHYPFEEWNGRFRGYYHLHGHLPYKGLQKQDRRYLVSCDATEFEPMTLDELILIDRKEDEEIKLADLEGGEHFWMEIGVFVVLEQEDGYTKVATCFRESGCMYAQNTCAYQDAIIERYCEKELYPAYYRCFGAGNIKEHIVDLTFLDGTPAEECICRLRPPTYDEVMRHRREFMDSYSTCWTCTAFGFANNKIVVYCPDDRFALKDPDQYAQIQVVFLVNSDILVKKEE